MKKALMLLASVALIAGCATAKVAPGRIETCDGKLKHLKVAYGDGFIDVDYRTSARRSEFAGIKVDLQPRTSAPRARVTKPMKDMTGSGSGTDYRNKTIEFRGKTDKEIWLDRNVSENDPDDHKVFCIGNKAVGTYQFSVHVPGVGTIDPIIDIID